MNRDSSKDAVVSIFGFSFKTVPNGAIPMLILSRCGWCKTTGWPVLAGTVCFASHSEIMMKGMARLAVSPLQRFLVYCRIIHCGQSGRKPEGVGETQ